ncbi:MAG: DUF4876 domain-containing protein [Bacteroides sp.]|nr:DUF4876 domain-containing protein [Bacteroides sp.]
MKPTYPDKLMKSLSRTLLPLLASIVAALGMPVLLTSCEDSVESGELTLTPLTLGLVWPDDMDTADSVIESVELTCRNISSGELSSFATLDEVKVLPGLYDIDLSVTLSDAGGTEVKLSGAQRSVTVGRTPEALSIPLFRALLTDDLIIAEIFFTGTLHSSGNPYTGDDYIKLYNNTDHVVYADGLTLFETKFTTTEKRDYTPDIMAEAVTVQALYTIPGSGKEHPVQPGEYLLLADTGIDHKVSNPNSLNLSHADFEWYDVSSTPSSLDIDSAVPNLDKWYCYTLSYWVLHNRGFKGYGIARIPIGREEYLADYLYTYDYLMETAAGTFPMSASAYRMPNDWIVDMVNCSIESGFAWTLCAPELDSGWTHCGSIDHDKTRYFKSVRRKLSHFSADGHPVFKDTNNSSADFNADAVPSEIELQQSAIDRTGTPCHRKTYDGIIPVTEQ